MHVMKSARMVIHSNWFIIQFLLWEREITFDFQDYSWITCQLLVFHQFWIFKIVKFCFDHILIYIDTSHPKEIRLILSYTVHLE